MTKTMQLVVSHQGEQAIQILTGAATACYQFLPKEDTITKQAIKYIERIIKVTKRIP